MGGLLCLFSMGFFLFFFAREIRVAEDLKRPLYVVGASELGFSPQDVEHKLREILDVRVFFVFPHFIVCG